MSENQSVYQAFMRSPQWKAWYEHAENNHLFDVDETAECDWMSDKHFQAFIEFCKTLDVCTWCGGNWINKSCSQCGADIQKQ